jgi:hypothetical protein
MGNRSAIHGATRSDIHGGQKSRCGHDRRTVRRAQCGLGRARASAP